VSLEYNWAYGNAGSGFTLSGGDPLSAAAHKLRHNASWDNRVHGFTDDGGTGAAQLSNNTAYHNGGSGFALPNAAAAVLRANASIDNAAGTASVSATAALSRNSWQLDGWSAATFRSTDPAAATGLRRPDGGLPRTDYLTTGNGVGASMSG
jgi:hypothetical protein